MGFRLFSFSNFTFVFHGFYLKKLKIFQLMFELARGKRRNLVLKSKDNWGFHMTRKLLNLVRFYFHHV